MSFTARGGSGGICLLARTLITNGDQAANVIERFTDSVADIT